MRAVDCVGALIQDEHHRVYVHRRTAERRLLPGIWDIVGGHLERGETPERALARELEEETGWRLREIQSVVTDWEWEHQGVVRRELDYLVTVDGDLGRPRLDLEPVTGPGEVLTGHAADLEALQADPWVANWYAGAWSTAESVRRAADMQASWEKDGVSKWMAHERKRGQLVGRGGLSRLAPDLAVTHRITDVLDDHGDWLADRLELGWALRTEVWSRGFRRSSRTRRSRCTSYKHERALKWLRCVTAQARRSHSGVGHLGVRLVVRCTSR
jgi:8-oxo-dGTP pyrophosphatase MutT (NUDIX family)